MFSKPHLSGTGMQDTRHYLAAHRQATNNETFSFTAEQLTKFVANVVIQITQPQVCYPKQGTLELKSSMCQKDSNAAKMILNVDITGKDLFESSVLSTPLPPPPPPPPHTIQVHKHQSQPSIQTHLKSIHSSKIHLST